MYKGDPGELKNWLTTIKKKQLFYKLSEVETALLAYDAAEGPVHSGAPSENPWNSVGCLRESADERIFK